jgi:DNA uptake protein ComE-like DNA-binding protein
VPKAVSSLKVCRSTPEINALIYPAGENFNGSPDSKGKIIRTAAFREEYKNADNNNVQEFKAGSKTSRNTQKQYKSRSPIDLNACDSAALESLPGIGPVLSVRILKYRNLLGGYASVSQLTEVYGLPPETYEMIKGRLFADSLSVKKINVNSVGYKELSRFPYLESYDVTAILKFRQIQNKIQNLEELVKNNVLAPEKAARIKPYLAFE